MRSFSAILLCLGAGSVAWLGICLWVEYLACSSGMFMGGYVCCEKYVVVLIMSCLGGIDR